MKRSISGLSLKSFTLGVNILVTQRFGNDLAPL